MKFDKESAIPDLLRAAGVLTIAVSSIVLGILSDVEGWWIPITLGLVMYVVGEKLD